MVNKRSILSRSAQKYEINCDEGLVWRLDITLLAYTIQALEASERNADSQSDNQMNFLKTTTKNTCHEKGGIRLFSKRNDEQRIRPWWKWPHFLCILRARSDNKTVIIWRLQLPCASCLLCTKYFYHSNLQIQYCSRSLSTLSIALYWKERKGRCESCDQSCTVVFVWCHNAACSVRRSLVSTVAVSTAGKI